MKRTTCLLAMTLTSLLSFNAFGECHYKKIDQGTADEVDKLSCSDDGIHTLAIENGKLNGLTLYYDIRAVAPPADQRKRLQSVMDVAIDGQQGHILSSKMLWTNDFTLSSASQDAKVIIDILNDIKNANKKITLAIMTEKSKDFRVFGVKNSSSAASKFMNNAILQH